MNVLKSTVISILGAVALAAGGFEVESSAIKGQIAHAQVFNGFGCTGENISPELSWKNVPRGTKSFALTLYDPDAPTGSGWWHWVVTDIPADIRSLKSGAGSAKGSLPKGALQSMTSFGSAGFGGACPPKGHPAHRYILTVYALDVKKLGLNENSTPSLAGYMINQHTIAKTSVIAYYSR